VDARLRGHDIEKAMTLQEYLQAQLEQSARYTLTDADRVLIEHDGMEAFIFKTLMRKPFRKWALPEELLQRIHKAIQYSVQQNEPIHCVWPFGGYKLWRLPSSPEVDWAEFFSILYFNEYFSPITAAYSPGVRFVFTSDDHLLTQLSNIPQTETDAYCDSLERLIAVLAKSLPNNMQFFLLRFAAIIEKNKTAYVEQLAKAVHEQEKIFSRVSEESRAAELRKAALNIRWDGAENLTGITEEEKRRFIEKAPVLHDAHYSTPLVREYYAQQGLLEVFTTKFGSNIAIGTTKSSRTKFCTGFGILEKHKDSWQPRILSPQQFEKAKDMPHDVVPSDLIPLKNFTEIWTFPEAFSFS